jgi:hypothetical protein
MENQPHNDGYEPLGPTPEQAVSPEARRINEGIAEALRDG